MRALLAFSLAAALAGTPAAGSGPTKPRSPARRPTPAPEPRAVPIENPRVLQPFFDALRRLGRPAAGASQGESPGPGVGLDVVRVLHFGDSHVAADWWTDELRRALQGRFGDAGVGLVMPGRPWSYFHHERATSPRANWQTLGLGREPGDGLVGLSGVALAPRPRAEAASVIAGFSRFEIQLGLPAGEACVQVSVDGAPLFSGWLGADGGIPAAELEEVPVRIELAPLEPGAGDSPPVMGSCRALAFITGEVPAGEHVLSVDDACGGLPLVLGVDLRGDAAGVLVDTLGLNGAEMVWLERADPAVRRALLARVGPRLLVLSYGANDMTATGFTREGYVEQARRILAALRRDAPEATILVTGPTDRSHRRKGARRELVRRNEPEIVGALREAALAEGCAFWDARAAMGGEGSIDAWRKRGLAGRDLVHLTERGYRILGSLLAESLLGELDRQGNEPATGAGP